MLTVAFLANLFPSPIEPYVSDEIAELHRRGVRVIAGSVRGTARAEIPQISLAAEIVVLPLQPLVCARAAWLCLRKWNCIAPLIGRIALQGKEGLGRRLKAMVHTFLGSCYAVKLQNYGIDHIHAHHGYFGSWVAMTAARLLEVPFSMTLYGSDLLLHAAYLDAKLQNCAFCLNVSEFNRQHILQHYPEVDPAKLPVLRLGVDVPEHLGSVTTREETSDAPLVMLAVGRLHRVKDHAFLVRACAELHRRNVPFQCFVVGDGPEREHLARQIQECNLSQEVRLLGYVSREERDALYDRADLVVLTSRSEGIPVVLMEAMARGKLVLAPAITGIPELVIHGKTGFLYEAGQLDDFVERLISIRALSQAVHPRESGEAGGNCAEPSRLEWIRRGARVHVRENFNRTTNVKRFGDLFLRRVAPHAKGIADENFILQQI